MPRPTEPVKRVCYADDLTVWATGVKIPDLEDSINRYLEEITAYLKDNSLLISAPKSTVTLFSPDPHQAKTHPRILIEESQLPLVQCPKILGVYLDTSLSLNKHNAYVTERVSSRNNILLLLYAFRDLWKEWGDSYFQIFFTELPVTPQAAEVVGTEQYPQGIGRYIMGTTEGDMTDDLQGSCEIDYQLCCTCLEYKPTRRKLQKHPIYTERGSEDCHWLRQYVQC